MKSTLDFVGKSLVVVGALMFFALTFIVKSDGVSGTQDLFGLTVPQPPDFTAFIPYLGYVIGKLFEMISLHGLVSLALPLMIIVIGLKVSESSRVSSKEVIPEKFQKSALELQKEIEEHHYK